jgi:hypothetical protein
MKSEIMMLDLNFTNSEILLAPGRYDVVVVLVFELVLEKMRFVTMTSDKPLRMSTTTRTKRRGTRDEHDDENEKTRDEDEHDDEDESNDEDDDFRYYGGNCI